MGAMAIPLAMMAAGTAVNYYNTKQTAKNQDNALAQQIRNQQNIQHQADARTAQMIQQQGQQTDTKEKAAGLAANQAVLQANAAQAQKVFQTPGAVSQAYKQSGANAAQGITDFGNQQADMQSSINAPMQQRQNNRVNIDNYGNDLGLIARKAKGQDFLDSMNVQAVRRNPWLDVAGSLLGGGARAYSTYSGGVGNYDYLKNTGDPNSSDSFDYLGALMNPRSPYNYGGS